MCGKINLILKTSCAKLLAAKFKLRTRAKVYKKFTTDLNYRNAEGKIITQFLKPDYTTNNMRFLEGKSTINSLFASSKSLARIQKNGCAKCGSMEKVEMHHVRKMADLNPKISQIDRIMVRARRKQTPLCRKCHMEHHRTNR